MRGCSNWRRVRTVANIGSLRGVGAKTAPLFVELGIETAADLLDYFPFRYDDLRYPVPARELGNAGGEENAVGTIDALKERRIRDLEIVEASMHDDEGAAFAAKWIGRRRFVYGRLHEGMRLYVRGRVERNLAHPVVNVAQYAILGADETYRGELVPVYRASKRLASRKIAGVVRDNFATLLAEAAEDAIPPAIARTRSYPSLEDAYRAIHRPADPQQASNARDRFVFAEFLALATGAQLRRLRRERETDARQLHVDPGLLAEFEAALPFAMTGAQRRVVSEVWRDMARNVPMNRMLQGDVGSGKTLVAAAAVVLAARNGLQSALMAPTELLASQHAAKLAPMLLPLRVGVEAIIGGQSQRARNGAIDRLASGEAALAVGTHALLTESVEFDRLGLVVIDEQHRFGVEQRARLRAKGGAPHTLHMTATPIPRTLAQSIYADLDVSTIDELPPGRTPIETFAVRSSRKERVYEFVAENVRRGRQAYVVTPAIEEGDSGLTGAVEEFERMQRGPMKGLRLGLLHGRMPQREKDDSMARFARGEIDVLVATTVVEVGIDVANATVMVVLDAHRYGLAQLHQLRGRVGRGAIESYCVLAYDDEAGERDRLGILTRTTDGFVIAEEDLRLRGPGEFAGTVQSGSDGLRFADLARDVGVYAEAKSEAETIVRDDERLVRPENAGLRWALERQPSTRSLLLSS
jgi:ATP-dependent DNA helicase RecG